MCRLTRLIEMGVSQAGTDFFPENKHLIKHRYLAHVEKLQLEDFLNECHPCVSRSVYAIDVLDTELD